MVVKEDGSKWACQSCLKGHRVSGCTHTDRELTLVPKKGRPVTQCHHCRLERKKRSAHVRCDCGESDKAHHPKEKCIHLREAEERARLGYHEDQQVEKDPAYLAAVAEEQGCCCHHGGKCTCAILKKETEGPSALHGPAVKPRLEKTISDGAITVFTNGHHKPVHRKNHAAHECGMPYKMPMPRLGTETRMPNIVGRSVDDLALDSGTTYHTSETVSQNDAPFNMERRKSKSEQPSPKMPPFNAPCGGLGDQQLASIDFSTLAPTQTNSTIASYSSDHYIPSFDPMSGTADSSFDPWSAFPSSEPGMFPNNNPFGVWPSSNDNNSTSQPALTAASSGTQSEIDEIPPMDDVYGFHMPSIQEDTANDVNKLPSGNSPLSNRRSLPPGFFGNTDFAMGGANGNWPASGNSNVAEMDKSQDMLSPTVDDFWQFSASSSVPNVAQRALGGPAYSPRPQSRSVGSVNAPNDDIMKQLFPEIDIDNSTFGSNGSPQMNLATDKASRRRFNSNPTSAPMDFGPMDEDVGFTSQSWGDGSMSIPNDTFTTSYELDQDFSNPEFSGNWSQ